MYLTESFQVDLSIVKVKLGPCVACICDLSTKFSSPADYSFFSGGLQVSQLYNTNDLIHALNNLMLVFLGKCGSDFINAT